MGDKSGIEWTDATWNPTTGCTKVSLGCRNCYALREWARLSANPDTVYYGRPFTDVQVHEDRLDQPARWTKPRRIFVDSMSDLFHAAIPDTFIARVFEQMHEHDRHIYQVLTKRPDRMRAFLAARDWFLPAHIQVGVSAEDQLTWDERVPQLLMTTATTKFVSLEPLLGPINGRGDIITAGQWHRPPVFEWPIGFLQWVIVGGESGPAARPTHPMWVQDLADQCRLTGVPFFFKQWGEWVPTGVGAVGEGVVLEARKRHDWDTGHQSFRVGKKAAGRLLNGRTYDGHPAQPS